MKVSEFKNMVGKQNEKVIAIDFDGVIHKNSKGFYDGAPSFKLVSSSNEASQVFGDYIIGSFIGSVESGSLTFTALNDIPSNNLLIKMATPQNPLNTDSGGLIGDLELGLQLRGGIFENQVGTQVILQELENIS